MKPQHQKIFRDEVDSIVDDIIANPTRADELKGRLRLAISRKPVRSTKPAAEDPDEYWNNVPI